MRICRDCKVKMREVMSFSKKNMRDFQNIQFVFDELGHKIIEKNDFDEIFKREVDNRR